MKGEKNAGLAAGGSGRERRKIKRGDVWRDGCVREKSNRMIKDGAVARGEDRDKESGGCFFFLLNVPLLRDALAVVRDADDELHPGPL